jgi:streptogramin lyase/tRNA A-37 threonylcarbamoyl transferase component Bud32
MSEDPRIGTELAGYRILEVLGRGGMGVVFLAEQAFPKRRVALKLLVPNLAEDERFRERFVRESNLAASIDHPNIIPIYGAGEADGVLYIAMRYVQGTDLRTLLRAAGALSLERTVEIVSPVAAALDDAHAEGLVHRDVKPGNILIASGRGPESSGHVYLSDFGLTKRATSDSGITGTGQFMGSIDYAAPEQFQGKALDGRTDEYSLGCVMFECLSGRPPFRRDEEAAVMYGHLMERPPAPSELRTGIPPGVDEVIARALAKSPDDRYPTCGRLVAALAAAKAPVEARTGPISDLLPEQPAEQMPARERPTPPKRPERLPSGRRRALAGAALATVVVAGAMAWLLTRGGATPAPGPTGQPGHATDVKVLRLDPGTGTVQSTIPAPALRPPIFGRAAIEAGEGGVWLLGGGGLTDIDPDTGRSKGNVPTIGSTNGVAVGVQSVWVVSGDIGGATPGRLYKINPATDEQLKVLPVGTFPAGVAVGLGAVWVADATTGSLHEVDPITVRLRRSVGGFGAPNDLAVGVGAVWAADSVARNVIRFDIRTGKLRPIAVTGADAVAVGFDRVWVLDTTAGTVAELDKAGGLVDTFRVGITPSDVATGAGSVWVANKGDGTVSRIDPATGEITVMEVGGGPIAIAADDEAVWVLVISGST